MNNVFTVLPDDVEVIYGDGGYYVGFIDFLDQACRLSRYYPYKGDAYWAMKKGKYMKHVEIIKLENGLQLYSPRSHR